MVLPGTSWAYFSSLGGGTVKQIVALVGVSVQQKVWEQRRQQPVIVSRGWLPLEAALAASCQHSSCSPAAAL